jgi:uncharacterized membrane protein
MLVAPLMTPIMGMAVSLVLAELVGYRASLQVETRPTEE